MICTARSKAAGLATILALAVPLTAHFEGLRLKAYLDPVGIPTICYGETHHVKIGDTKTKQECDALIETRLGSIARAIDIMITPPMKPETHAALTSFAYNVGLEAFRQSTLRRKLNAGDLVGACNELPRWNKAKGKTLKGLTRRRQAERKLCLKGGIDV